MFSALLAILAVTTALANPIDQKLSLYVEMFQLKPLPAPTNIDPKLAKLGRSLFGDPRLSGNKNISCMDCHHPMSNTTDGLPLGLGEGAEGIQTGNQIRSQKKGVVLGRNTPALFNLDGINVMFWDGRVSFNPLTKEFSTPVPLKNNVATTLTSALAAQALFPMVDHSEMRGQTGTNEIANAQDEYEAWDAIVARVKNIPEYKTLFNEIYPAQEMNIGHIGNALAEFQRSSFFLADTPYDNYLKGDLTALNEAQKIGMVVFFGKGRCGECHQGPHLSTFEFHSVGAPQIGPGKLNGDDPGRELVDQLPSSQYAFRVPPLRNVALTAPYMHDGAYKTLGQVVEHYDTVVESMTGYKLVNNWKNYIDKISDHDHSNDVMRERALSSKLSKRLNFEVAEEKAINEFLSTALTDKKLAAREIDGDYETYFRLQLRSSGFDKLNTAFKGIKDNEVFYYFDTLLDGSFYLRDLAQPVRLILVKRSNGTELIYREQIYKTAVANNGIVLGGNFNRDEYKMVPAQIFSNIEKSYLDMFERVYSYNDGSHNEDLPVTELSIIKNDLKDMNELFHGINFDGAVRISDVMNQKKEDVFYVPTSFNSKETNTFTLNVEGKSVKCILQRSALRTETGGQEMTWAIEFETEKILKSETQRFGKALIQKLGLSSEDVGGGTPSPSLLTLKVLEQALK